MSEVLLIVNGNPIEGSRVGNQLSLQYAATLLTSKAKALAPVDLGQLRNSIMWKTVIKNEGFNDGEGKKAERKITVRPGEPEAYVGTNLDHAIYQEFGTRKMAPKPYLRPAAAILQGQPPKEVMKKIMVEQMLGALKKGQTRTKFL